MGTTAEKLNYLKETKTEIKNALETPSNIFRDYPSLIKKYIDNQPTSIVTDGICKNALNVPAKEIDVDGNSEQKRYEGYQLINTDVKWLNSGATKSKINTGVRITVDVANVYRSSIYCMGGSELLGKTITLKTNMFFSGNNNGQIIAFFGSQNNNAISRVENSAISKSEKKLRLLYQVNSQVEQIE